MNFYPRPPRGGRLRFGLCAALPVHISIHALREEGDPQLERGKLPVTNYFYPRPPRGGRRSACRRKLRCCPISIHALREEGDARCCRARSFLAGFLSTPSARRATCTSGRSYPDSAISIHALREEGDNCSSLAAAMTGRISIHALREEGDQNLT